MHYVVIVTGDLQVGSFHPETISIRLVQQLRKEGGSHQDVRASCLHHWWLPGHDAKILVVRERSCKLNILCFLFPDKWTIALLILQVTFKSVLFIPTKSPQELFNNYGKRTDLIKMYVRRVFITDNFEDMMPKYLAFVKGVVSTGIDVVWCCGQMVRIKKWIKVWLNNLMNSSFICHWLQWIPW